MAQVLGTVISIELETDVKKNGGGTYKGWELVYKTPDGEVRNVAKPVQGLKYNAALTGQLKALASGDQFTLEQEKNAAGFFDVKTVVKGWSEGVASPSAPATYKADAAPRAEGNAKGNSYQASSYPTADERLKTQNQIVRQSSLAQANATLAIGGKAVKPADVIAVANQYVAWVKHEATGMEAIAELESDIPD
jgi:hypothetical protein